MKRWRLWLPVLWLAFRSRDARRRLGGILLRHTPALTLESWRATVTVIVIGISLIIPALPLIPVFLWLLGYPVR